MKVLYFMNHVDQGGAALALYDLIVELKRKYLDYEAIVITGKQNKLNDMFTKIGIENYSADFKNFMSSYKDPLFFTRPILCFRYHLGKIIGKKEIEKLIDFNTVDIIHSNLNRIDIGAIMATKHKIPHVWHIREHASLISGLFRPQILSSNKVWSSKTNNVNVRHRSDFDLISTKKDPIKYMNRFNDTILEGNHFVAISNSVKNEWIKKGIREDSIHLIYDGIRTELFPINPCYTKHDANCKNGKINFVFLGGYAKEKGQEEVIDALSQFSKEELKLFHVDFFGNGTKDYIEHLNKKASFLIDIRNISFNDYDSLIFEKMYKYDVGLNCSNAEGFGRVTVEYMMSGLCPLAANTGASPEIVDNEINGLLYEKGNSNSLCTQIRKILNNPELIKEYGQKARIKALNKFSMNSHALNIYSLYKDILHD